LFNSHPVTAGKRNKLEIRDNVAKIFACHSAIRTGDALNATEMAALLDQLFAAETPYFCPHGRPVITKITLDELDKRFGRT
jgi:DNA mismatch repair protein MutL